MSSIEHGSRQESEPIAHPETVWMQNETAALENINAQGAVRVIEFISKMAAEDARNEIEKQ